MRTLKIGLTGGIGSGKSLALRTFARLGAETVSSDAVARAQAEPGGPAYRRIVSLFGAADRAQIAGIVFRSVAARRRLEKATHPFVIAEIRRRAKKARGVFVADVPLLFEAGCEKEFDATLAVAAPAARRVARVAKRDDVAPAAVRRRMAAQFTDSERAARADVVITNDGRPADFVRKIADYHRALRLLQRGAAA